MRHLLPLALLATACATHGPTAPYLQQVHTWQLWSEHLDEARRIFVFLPENYEESTATLPVLFMPDGGMREDLPHVAEAAYAGQLWGTLRPFIVVGIENTDRRRDLTPPTEATSDLEIAPRAGGAGRFRAFLRDELMPEVARRYRTNDVKALMGESLAGLFIVQTFLEEPELFDHCIAFSPSLWWNNGQLVTRAADLLAHHADRGTLYLTTANEPSIVGPTQELARALAGSAPDTSWWHYQQMPEQFHDTIYRASAPRALRQTFPAPPHER